MSNAVARRAKYAAAYASAYGTNGVNVLSPISAVLAVTPSGVVEPPPDVTAAMARSYDALTPDEKAKMIAAFLAAIPQTQPRPAPTPADQGANVNPTPSVQVTSGSATTPTTSQGQTAAQTPTAAPTPKPKKNVSFAETVKESLKSGMRALTKPTFIGKRLINNAINVDPNDLKRLSQMDATAAIKPIAVKIKDGIDPNNYGPQPLRFRRGHCAMQSFYEAASSLPAVGSLDVDQFLRLCSVLLHSHYTNSNEVRDYIEYGLYIENDCSSVVLGLLATHFNVKLCIKRRPALASDITLNREGHNKVTIYFFDYMDTGIGHYSASPRGGAKDKYPALLADFVKPLSYSGTRPTALIELSAAPGMFCMLASKQLENIAIFALVYKKGVAKHKDLTKPINIREYSTFTELTNIVKDIQKTHRVGYVLCDAGRYVNTESLTEEFCDVINNTFMTRKLEEDNTTIAIKTFANPIGVWNIAKHFRDVEVTSYMTDSTEKYYIMRNFARAHRTLEEMYHTYNQIETSHSVRISHKTLNEYRASFFRKEFLKFGSAVPQMPVNGHIDITFNAITGYASASKTTHAAAKYKDAMWIAPTKELSVRHSKHHGLDSNTQHSVFTRRAPTVIVVDECSQFFVEYLGLLHITFPNSKIVILGDIHQIPPFTADGTRGTLFSSIGVNNNIWETYAIPHDIVEILNRKYNFHMIPKGGASCGLLSVSGNPSLRQVPDFFKKIKFICFNQSTAQDLKAKKFNASTITTYTGSRSHTVVFYVDGASVQSQLLSRPEYVYTALTRATNQLVLYGSDSRMIEQYFAIDGHNIRTFEEINEIRLKSEMYLTNPETENGVIKVETMKEDIVTTPVSADVALDIVTKVAQPANATDVHINVAPNELPTVTGGVMRTTLDAVLSPNKGQLVYKLAPNNSLVKQQLSNNTLQTLQTLAVRYGQQKIKLTPRDLRVTSSELAKGLSMMLTGRPDCYGYILHNLAQRRNELPYHYKEYLISLSKKMGINGGGIAAEISREFNEFDEALEFFNKFQNKHDAKAGFDQSAKVGQGVSATSKTFNILYNAYSRFILTVCRDIARLNNRKIVLATFDDEETLSAEVAAVVGSCINEENQDQFIWDLGDLSSADKNYSSANRPLQISMLEACGAPQHLQTFYHHFRDKWRMRYQSTDGVTVLHGEGNQLTGCPATIQENTLHYGATHFAMKEYKDIQCVMVKGDDIAVLCRSSSYTVKGLAVKKNTGTIVKEHLSPVGEFAGWVLLPEGLFPDVVRYALKFIGKRYRDRAHFNEALESLACRLVAVRNQFHKIKGCQSLTHFYPTLTYGEIETLYDFLQNAHSIKFDDLTPCVEEPLVPLANNSGKEVFADQI